MTWTKRKIKEMHFFIVLKRQTTKKLQESHSIQPDYSFPKQ